MVQFLVCLPSATTALVVVLRYCLVTPTAAPQRPGPAAIAPMNIPPTAPTVLLRFLHIHLSTDAAAVHPRLRPPPLLARTTSTVRCRPSRKRWLFYRNRRLSLTAATTVLAAEAVLGHMGDRRLTPRRRCRHRLSRQPVLCNVLWGVDRPVGISPSISSPRDTLTDSIANSLRPRPTSLPPRPTTAASLLRQQQ
jgi:hypothetical protein